MQDMICFDGAIIRSLDVPNLIRNIFLSLLLDLQAYSAANMLSPAPQRESDHDLSCSEDY